MGEHGEITNFTLYLDGEPIAPVDIQNATITLSDTTAQYFVAPESVSMTCTIKHKNMHRMTRKRLVKIVMSRGVSRNTANAYARMVQASGQPYKSKWFDVWLMSFEVCWLMALSQMSKTKNTGGAGNEK